MEKPFDAFVALLEEEGHALLARYGTPCSDVNLEVRPKHGRWITATIGFTGEVAQGALTLVAPPGFWKGLANSQGIVGEAMLADMAGEMANMLIGRVRNRLMALGVVVHQATPTCAFGDAIVLGEPGDAETSWRAFVTPSGALHARFDALLGEVVLSETSEEAVLACESDLVLF